MDRKLPFCDRSGWVKSSFHRGHNDVNIPWGTRYPEPVPFQVLIPRWAETLPSETGGSFNVTYAKAVSGRQTHSPTLVDALAERPCTARQAPPPEHKKLSVRTIIAIVLSILGAILLIVAGFTVYQFKKPRKAAAPTKARPRQEDEEQFNSLRKSLELSLSGFSDAGGHRYSQVRLTTDPEDRSFSEHDRPRSFSHPVIAEHLYDPPATLSSHTGDHEDIHSRPALPLHSFTYPPPTASPTSASSSFYRYDPFNPPEADELSSGSHPPPTSSPYHSPGTPLRELSFPPPRKPLSPFPHEPYSPSSPRSRLLSPSSPRWSGHSRGRSGGHHEP